MIKIHLYLNEPEKAYKVWQDAQADFQVSNDGKRSAIDLALFAGDYVEANRIVREDLGEPDLSVPGPLFSIGREFMEAYHYLLIKREVGELEKFETALSSLEELVSVCKREGLTDFCHTPDAVARMHRGDMDGAMMALTKAVEVFRVDWDGRYDPTFGPLSDREDFHALFDRLDEHINNERAKLGWASAGTTR